MSVQPSEVPRLRHTSTPIQRSHSGGDDQDHWDLTLPWLNMHLTSLRHAREKGPKMLAMKENHDNLALLPTVQLFAQLNIPIAILAFGGHGKPTSPADCLVAAGICGLIIIQIACSAVDQMRRRNIRWGKKGAEGPLALLMHLAWATMFVAFAIMAICDACDFQPVTSRKVWLLGGAVVFFLTAGLVD